MPNGYDEDEVDTAVATSAATAPAKEAPQAADQKSTIAIEAKLPERTGTRRKIHFLWSKGQASYFRVNYHGHETITSYWVEVRGGLVTVTPEANQPFKADSK